LAKSSAAVVISLLLLGSIGASRVHAQDPAAMRTAAARSLFERGLAAADAHEWSQAIDAFRQAHALRSSPVIQLNLALALAEVHQVVEASEHLRAVLRGPELPEGMQITAERALRTVQARIAWVRLRVDGPLDGRSLLIDGRAASAELANALVPLDPGHHRVEVHQGRRVIARAELDLEDGAETEVLMHLPPPEGESATALLDPW